MKWETKTIKTWYKSSALGKISLLFKGAKPMSNFIHLLYNLILIMAITRANAISNKVLVATLLSAWMLMFSLQGVESIGICYGENGNNLPSAAETVELYKSNGVAKMRIYHPDQAMLNALGGSDIDLILDVPGDRLQEFASDSAAANQWVQDNVVRFVPAVKFRFISVGNEVEPSSSLAQFVGPAIVNIHQAIQSANLGSIQVSTSVKTDLLEVSYPPSAGIFKDSVKPYIGGVLDILAGNGAPLLVNVYPYFSYIGNKADIKLEYALFQSEECVNDGNLCYKNLFDATLDAVYSAMEKQGHPDMIIVVTETGWPSAGGEPAATVDNAATYYRNMISHNKAGGTPKKPGLFDCFLFAMYDENLKQPAGTEQHFGLFDPTTKGNKYGISFA